MNRENNKHLKLICWSGLPAQWAKTRKKGRFLTIKINIFYEKKICGRFLKKVLDANSLQKLTFSPCLAILIVPYLFSICLVFYERSTHPQIIIFKILYYTNWFSVSSILLWDRRITFGFPRKAWSKIKKSKD